MDVVLLFVVMSSYQFGRGFPTTDGDPFFTFNFTGQFNRLPYLNSIRSPSCTGTSIEVRYVAEVSLRRHFYYSIDGDKSLLSWYPLQTNLSGPFLYNQSLFNVTGLKNTEHTFQLNMGVIFVRSVLLMPKGELKQSLLHSSTT